MPTFKPGSVARVPFPHIDSARRQYRPAIVVSNGALGPEDGMLWVIMVTSADKRRWPGDVSLEDDHEAMGLPAPSLARTTKIATIEAAQAEWRGDIGADRFAAVAMEVAKHLGFAAVRA